MKSFIRSTMEQFPAAMRLYRNFRDLLDQRDPPRMTPWGFTLAGNAAMASGAYEPQETRLVIELLKQVDLMVNVGANVGYYCCHALSMDKQVIAVEPVVRNLHYLLKNIHDNGWADKAELFPVALGAKTDILQMWGGGTGASLIKGWASIPESYVTRVPVLSLDRVLGNVLQQKRALILVDIEGAEYMMLQGAAQTLVNEPRPIWMIEIVATEHQPAGIVINPEFAQTFEMFFSLGYRAYTADGMSQEMTMETIGKVASGQHQLETHNFVFR